MSEDTNDGERYLTCRNLLFREGGDEGEPDAVCADMCRTPVGMFHLLDCPVWLGHHCRFFAEREGDPEPLIEADLGELRETFRRDYMRWRYWRRVRELRAEDEPEVEEEDVDSAAGLALEIPARPEAVEAGRRQPRFPGDAPSGPPPKPVEEVDLDHLPDLVPGVEPGVEEDEGSSSLISRSVVLVRLSAIGDVIHTMPLAMALRRARTDLDLTWVVQPESADLLRGHPAVSRVAVFPRRGSLAEQTAALRRLRRRRYDLLLDPQGNTKSGLVSRAIRARRRIGVNGADTTEWPNRLMHRECVEPFREEDHVVLRYLTFAWHLGLGEPPVEFGLAPTERERLQAEEMLAAAGLGSTRPVVVLQVGSLGDVRQWRADRMAQTADRLAGSGYGAVVTTGPAHVDDGREVVRLIEAARTLDACGTLDLRRLLALFAVLSDRPGSVLVSGDTAPVHLAVAVGLRVVGLYGSQPAERNGPFGGLADVVHRQAELDCAPCRARTCERRAEPRACMDRIGVEEVVSAVLRRDRAHR